MREKLLLTLPILAILFFACKHKSDAPDVSGIKAEVSIERFEKDFFKTDTNHITEGLMNVRNRYPNFYGDFMMGILQLNPRDSMQNNEQVARQFISSYHSLNDSVQQKFPDLKKLQSQLEDNFRYVKYYFPDYKIPGIISFVGPLDAPGVAITNHYIAIGLQQFLGSNFSAYQTSEIQQMYPYYISRRFAPEYIPVSCMKIVGEDMFPDNSTGQPLIVQMIEKGKRLYLLDHFMPDTPDSLKTGFTGKQVEWTKENEGLIWNYIITNEDLYSVDPVVMQTYIGEGPFTQNMPEASPGNIGPWVGWQIVKKYAETHPDAKPADIMQTDAKKILEEAKYKPK